MFRNTATTHLAFTFLCLPALCCLMVDNAPADTLHVPAEFPTIQAAIDAAINNDTIMVADGTYTGPGNRDLDFGGKAIAVRSASDHPGACIIDCESLGRAFIFDDAEPPAALVRGFTIRNGSADLGGAMYCDSSTPTIQNCSFERNSALAGNETTNKGGAIYCFNSDPVISDCRFVANSAFQGGAVRNWGSNPLFRNCSFEENAGLGAPGSDGGAASNRFAKPVFESCFFALNRSRFGGAVYEWDASGSTFRGCEFVENESSSSGGAFLVEGSFGNAALFELCTFLGNRGAGGGAVASIAGDVNVLNCLFALNESTGGGGAILSAASLLQASNCTFVDNNAAARGGAINTRSSSSYPGEPSAANIMSSIFWANTATNGGDQLSLRLSGNPLEPPTLTLTYCDVQGGQTEVAVDPGTLLNWGPGNIDGDPQFAGPLAGDYRLMAASPCIDAGDPAFLPVPGETDLYGKYRLWDGDGNGVDRVDLGVHEYGSRVFGDLNCDGFVDNEDIDPFVLSLTNPSGYAQQYPGCRPILADLNGDGLVDNEDIDPFVALIAGP